MAAPTGGVQVHQLLAVGPAAAGAKYTPDEIAAIVFIDIAIIVLVVGVNLLGDGLNDALGPRD